MNKAEAIKVAGKYFPSYPGVNEFHITGDEQAFENVNDARNHAKTLEKDNQNVVSVKRDEKVVVETKTPPVELTPEQKLEAAKKKVADATLKVGEKQQALNDADGPKKGAATIALNKATNALQVAKDELTALSN